MIMSEHHWRAIVSTLDLMRMLAAVCRARTDPRYHDAGASPPDVEEPEHEVPVHTPRHPSNREEKR